MAKKPTYEELEQRVKELEKEAAERKRMEEALRENEERFRSVVEGSLQGIIILQGSIIQFANQAAARIFGYSEPEQLIGLNMREVLVAPQERAELQRRGSDILSGKSVPVHYGWQGVRKDGERIWIESSASLISWKSKPAMLSFFIDVTEREQAQQALRKSEEKYRTLFEQSRDPIFISTRDGEWVNVNQSMLELFGYTAEEMIGMNARKLYVDLADRKGIIGEIEQKGSLTDYEVRYRKKDGTPLDCLVTATIRWADDGSIWGYQGIIRDITASKRAEKEIRKLSSAAEQSIDGIAIGDLEPRLTYVNHAFARMHGYTPEEMIGMSVVNLHNEEQMDEFKRGIDQIKTQGSWMGEIGHIRKNGTPFPTYMSVTVLKGDDGKPTGILAVARDITTQNKLEDQLAQAQKVEAIGTLAGGIAHNFNNLLMGVMGNTSLMLLETDASHPNYERLKTIEKSVQSGSKLTSQLLGYAREGRYEIKPLSLNQLVKETANTFDETKKEIRVHQELAQDLFGMNADQGQIEQALLNLYVNASDAMPGGGDLFLKTMNVSHKDMKAKHYKVKPGNYVLLTVRDTGTGMDKKTQERIFDPFFTTKAMGRGTGLGLASVYGIIKAHGGYIDVESKKGHGTTFSIYLPASSEKETIKLKELPQRILKGKETILLVDDEEIVLDAGEGMLKALGYKVLLAKNGKEAIELYKENKDNIHMILLDMIMPDMGGGETYDKLKKMNPDIKVLLSSGYSIDGQAEQILERGCDGFIQKPFNLEKLSQGIRKVLDQK